jgi:hypothetical protein
MLKRLVVGLILGIIIGGLAAAAFVKGFVPFAFGAVVAYLSAALVGVVTGLVAGKPIWSSGGQIEAGLKALVGALLAAGGMFALRQWANVHVTLPMEIGDGALGQLPVTTLPIIGAILGGFYELDNTPGEKEAETKKRAPAADAAKKRVAVDPDEEEEPEVASKKAKR